MDLEQKAIERLRLAALMSERYYDKPLLVTYSGGKDSDVCVELARRAGIRFEVEHSLTTADAPETVRHVREKFHGLELEGIRCEILRPRYKGKPTSMWSLIPIKLMPPTRIVRYCCQVLKEGAGAGRAIVTGIRWSESTKRASRGAAESLGRTIADRLTFDDGDEGQRQMVEHCKRKGRIVHNPIIEWTDGDVWTFLHDAGVKTNPLYSCFCRVGCVGCPVTGPSRYDEFRQWPAYENLYRKAFARMMEARRRAGKETDMGRTADEIFRWWMEDKNLDGQLDLFGGEIGG